VKFLIVSKEALAVDLAWQLTKEGHTVRFHVQGKVDRDVGDGLVEKADAWEPNVE